MRILPNDTPKYVENDPKKPTITKKQGGEVCQGVAFGPCCYL